MNVQSKEWRWSNFENQFSNNVSNRIRYQYDKKILEVELETWYMIISKKARNKYLVWKNINWIINSKGIWEMKMKGKVLHSIKNSFLGSKEVTEKIESKQ